MMGTIYAIPIYYSSDSTLPLYAQSYPKQSPAEVIAIKPKRIKIARILDIKMIILTDKR